MALIKYRLKPNEPLTKHHPRCPKDNHVLNGETRDDKDRYCPERFCVCEECNTGSRLEGRIRWVTVWHLLDLLTLYQKIRKDIRQGKLGKPGDLLYGDTINNMVPELKDQIWKLWSATNAHGVFPK